MDLRSATSIGSFRRDVLNDMAEHGPVLKNKYNTRSTPFLISQSKTSENYLKQVLGFYCVASLFDDFLFSVLFARLC